MVSDSRSSVPATVAEDRVCVNVRVCFRRGSTNLPVNGRTAARMQISLWRFVSLKKHGFSLMQMAAKSVVHSLAWCAWSGRQMTSRVCRHVEAQARLGTGTCRRSFLTASARLTASRHVLTTTEDRYNAIHVNLPPDISVEEFDTQLESEYSSEILWKPTASCGTMGLRDESQVV